MKINELTRYTNDAMRLAKISFPYQDVCTRSNNSARLLLTQYDMHSLVGREWYVLSTTCYHCRPAAWRTPFPLSLVPKVLARPKINIYAQHRTPTPERHANYTVK